VQATTSRADGTALYYETRGAGQPVLILQGGVSDAGATAQLAAELAQDHLVISYDRRGLSRSTAASSVPVTMDTHADDASAVLAAASDSPAVLVGASIGALIGLHLAARHPKRVALAVAHEPPMASVLRDPVRERAFDAIEQRAQHDVVAAIQQMGALTDSGTTTPEPGAQPGELAGDLRANLTTFFRHDFAAVRGSQLDAARLRETADPARIVPTGGQDSRGQWEHRCAQVLAEQLQRPLHELPGGHNGLTSHPRSIARAVRGWVHQAI
jgi:pimeloyl-ACP methyl ester carboxylesterase